MPHAHANPIVADYPADDFCCVKECADGTCTDPIQDKIQSHLNVLSWAQGQAATAAPCPGPCPGPCSAADLAKFHKHMTTNGKLTALPNWLTALLGIIQLVEPAIGTLVQELLALLNPPTPAPAKP